MKRIKEQRGIAAQIIEYMLHRARSVTKLCKKVSVHPDSLNNYVASPGLMDGISDLKEKENYILATHLDFTT